MSTFGINLTDLIQQRKIQEMLAQANAAPETTPDENAAAAGYPKFDITRALREPSQIPGTQAPQEVSSVMGPVRKQFEAPVRPQVQPMRDEQLDPMRDLYGYEKAPIETTPDAINPVAPYGRDMATPPLPDYAQKPKEVTAAQQNLQKAASITEDPISRKRKFAALMAGIGTGIAAKDPYEGMSMYGRIVHAPYHAKVDPILERQAMLNQSAKLATDAQKLDLEGRRTEAQTTSDLARARETSIQADRLQRTPIPVQPWGNRSEEEYRRKAEIDAQAFKPSSDGKLYTINTTDGGDLKGVTRLQTKPGEYEYRNAKGALIDPKLIADIAEQTKERETGMSAYSDWYKAFVAQHKRTPTTKEIQEYNDLQKAPGVDPKLREDLIRAQIAKMQREGGTPGSGALVADQVAKNPMLAGDTRLINKTNAKEVSAEYEKKYKVPMPRKMTPQEYNLQDSAIKTMHYTDSVRDIMRRNPNVASYLGIREGTLGKLETFIGRDLSGADPQTQQDVADLRNSINYVLAAEASNVGRGMGATRHMIDLLQKTSPATKMTPDYFEGGLRSIDKAAQDNLATVMEAIHGPTFMVGSKRAGKSVPRIKHQHGAVYVYDDKLDDYVRSDKTQ